MLPLPSGRSTSWDADRCEAAAVVVSIVAVVALSALALSVGGAAAQSAGNGSATVTSDDAQADDGPALTVADADTRLDQDAQFDVALSAIPEGLAGFEVTLAVSDPEVAVITGAEYPDTYDHTSDPRISDDGSEITVEAVDLRDQVGPGDDDVGLATVSVRGETPGQTTHRVTDYQIDADGGARLEPALDRGTVTVDTDASAEPSSTEAANAESDGGDRQEATTAASNSGIDDIPILLVVGALGAIVAAVWVGTTDRITWP